MHNDELNIFNDAYFDNDDYDVDSANESIGGWLLANFAVFTTLLIKTIVRYSKQASKSHKTIINVNEMVAHGMSKAEATKHAKKSIEWLRNRGYTYVDSNSPVLMYNDLTTEGKQFVDGYFEHIGDMDTFSIKKAVSANKSKLATLSRVADNVTAVLNVIILVFYTAATPAGVLLFPATLAMSYWAGTDLGESIVRILKQVRYNDNKPNDADAIESAEDVDIFDEDCFDDAVESSRAKYDKNNTPLNNKAKKHDYDKFNGELLLKNEGTKLFSDKSRKKASRENNLIGTSYKKGKDKKGNLIHYAPNDFRHSNSPSKVANREYMLDISDIDMTDEDNEIRYGYKKNAVKYAKRDGKGVKGNTVRVIKSYHNRNN